MKYPKEPDGSLLLSAGRLWFETGMTSAPRTCLTEYLAYEDAGLSATHQLQFKAAGRKEAFNTPEQMTAYFWWTNSPAEAKAMNTIWVLESD